MPLNRSPSPRRSTQTSNLEFRGPKPINQTKNNCRGRSPDGRRPSRGRGRYM
uniref:Uncharacterized protein n=1 Tax=Arundo donax TaxID=35708 RepID=A0A0A8Z0V2_ARUDO